MCGFAYNSQKLALFLTKPSTCPVSPMSAHVPFLGQQTSRSKVRSRTPAVHVAMLVCVFLFDSVLCFQLLLPASLPLMFYACMECMHVLHNFQEFFWHGFFNLTVNVTFYVICIICSKMFLPHLLFLDNVSKSVQNSSCRRYSVN